MCDDPRGIVRIGATIGLNELEGSEVADGAFGCEAVWVVPESDLTVLDPERDHQRCKEVEDDL